MTGDDFDSWVASRPWPLSPVSEVENKSDREWLGTAFKGQMLETTMEPNGKQLRVYHQGDTTYISYNAI